MSCVTCGDLLPPYPGRGRPRKFCDPCGKAQYTAYYRRFRETHRERLLAQMRASYTPRPMRAKECRRCGASFTPIERNQQRYCSVDCREIVHRNRRAIPKSLRRKVLQRDNWTCYLCGGAIPEWVNWPHQFAGTADHVIPWKHGGRATLDNLRAAHWHCNRRKADSLPEAA